MFGEITLTMKTLTCITFTRRGITIRLDPQSFGHMPSAFGDTPPDFVKHIRLRHPYLFKYGRA
jgi:hypothetical protein